MYIYVDIDIDIRKQAQETTQQQPYNHQVLLSYDERQRAFQAFSVPGAEELQKLLSRGPWDYTFSNNCSKSNDDPLGPLRIKHHIGETPEVVVLRG